MSILIKPAYDADASTYFTTAGVTSTAGRQQISRFVTGIKDLGLWSSMVCWPLRSSQNAGGLIAYSLGGLGTYNGTLSSPNGPTWGANGITFDGTDDYLLTGYTSGLSQFSAFSIAKSNSNGGVQYEFSKDDVGSNREWGILGDLGGYTQGFLYNPILSQVGIATSDLIIRMLCMRASSSVYKCRKNNGADNSGTTGTLTQANANIAIGSRAGGGGLYFNGIISASILFNTALSDSNTSSIYTLYKTTLGAGLGLP